MRQIAQCALCRGRLGPAVLTLVLPLLASADPQPSPASGAWQKLRPQFYGTRAMNEVGDQLMSVEAPGSTPDPTATPVMIHFGKGLAGQIRQLRVFIDNNPMPLATTMNLASHVPVSEIDLRVRIDRFTSVRAIAETDDGRLEMRSTWVNASGGCSAPSSAVEGGALGQIRFRASSDGRALQLSIRHPNNSGFQIDPRTGAPIEPHFISAIRLSAGGRLLLEAETGISFSENPSLRIVTAEPLAGPVTVDATDMPTLAHFTVTWKPVDARGASTGATSGL